MSSDSNLLASAVPRLLPGGLSVDDRGTLVFCNDFQFEGIKRFYFVSNHRSNKVRAWHGHKHEAKYVIAVSGSALVCAVQIDDWTSPDQLSAVDQFVLFALNPAVLYIPPGYANGWMNLTDDAKLLFFSTATLEESLRDDYRFPTRYWDPWKTEER